MGPDTDNNVADQAFALLLCLMAVATAFSWTFRASFSALRHLPRFGTAGSPLAYTVVVRNLTAKNQAGLMLIEDLADPRPTFRDWRAAQLAEHKHLPRVREDFSLGKLGQLVELRELQINNAKSVDYDTMEQIA